MTPPRCLLTLAVLLGTLAPPLPADIYRRETGRGDSGDGRDYTGAGGATGPPAVGICQFGRMESR